MNWLYNKFCTRMWRIRVEALSKELILSFEHLHTDTSWKAYRICKLGWIFHDIHDDIHDIAKFSEWRQTQQRIFDQEITKSLTNFLHRIAHALIRREFQRSWIKGIGLWYQNQCVYSDFFLDSIPSYNRTTTSTNLQLANQLLFLSYHIVYESKW